MKTFSIQTVARHWRQIDDVASGGREKGVVGCGQRYGAQRHAPEGGKGDSTVNDWS